MRPSQVERGVPDAVFAQRSSALYTVRSTTPICGELALNAVTTSAYEPRCHVICLM